MFIQIFGKDACPNCETAVNISKTFTERNNCLHNYVYKKLDKDFTREEMLEKFPNARTFPQVIVNGKSIGGVNELKEYLKSKEI